MATRRRNTQAKTGKRATRKASGGRAKTARKRASGSRRARRPAAARDLELRPDPAAAPGPEAAMDRPSLRLAEPPRVEPPDVADTASTAAVRMGASGMAEADREAARLAREIEERAAAAAEDLHDLRRRADAASVELGRRREERETLREQAERELPGYGAIGLELAKGALRLARAMATAPLRIGLAFLRPRQA